MTHNPRQTAHEQISGRLTPLKCVTHIPAAAGKGKYPGRDDPEERDHRQEGFRKQQSNQRRTDHKHGEDGGHGGAADKAQGKGNQFRMLSARDAGQQRVAARVGDQYESKHERACRGEQSDIGGTRDQSEDENAYVRSDSISDPRDMVSQAVAENEGEARTPRHFRHQPAMPSQIPEAGGDHHEMTGGERQDGAVDPEASVPDEKQDREHVRRDPQQRKVLRGGRSA